MTISIEQMRLLLRLGPEVSDAAVVDAYASYDEGEAASELLTLDETKAHLKVTHDTEDALIMGMIAAAIGHLDGEDGWLGSSITRQPHVLRLDHFPSWRVRLPYPPAVSITSIAYATADDSFATVDPADFEIVGRFLQPKFRGSWPSASIGEGAVLITYQAGYTVLPPAMRAALLLMIEDLYSNRGSTVIGTIAAAIPMSTTVENLLAPFRVFS